VRTRGRHRAQLVPDRHRVPHPHLGSPTGSRPPAPVVCPALGIALGAVPPPNVHALTERTGRAWPGRRARVADLLRAGVRLISGGYSGINPRQAARRAHGAACPQDWTPIRSWSSATP
jgi:hypothetical protein